MDGDSDWMKKCIRQRNQLKDHQINIYIDIHTNKFNLPIANLQILDRQL
jgi:hypothetical protein